MLYIIIDCSEYRFVKAFATYAKAADWLDEHKDSKEDDYSLCIIEEYVLIDDVYERKANFEEDVFTDDFPPKA